MRLVNWLLILMPLIIACKSESSKTTKPIVKEIPDTVSVDSRRNIVKDLDIVVVEEIKPDTLVMQSEDKKPDTKIIPTKKKTSVKPKKKKIYSAISFDEEVFSFDTLQEGDVIEHNFVFKNIGKTPLIINGASATCGCTTPSYPFIPIEPGEKGFIGVRYSSVGKSGEQKPIVTVTANTADKTHKLHLNGFVVIKE